MILKNPEKMPSWAPPMLATLTEKRFSDPDWIYEEKFDGIRCLAYKKKGQVFLYSRNHKLLNSAFPELVEKVKTISKEDFIIDGEIVVYAKGKSSFSKLQNRLNVLDVSRVKGKPPSLTYYVFDCLFSGSKDWRGLPLLERKQVLKESFFLNRQVRHVPYIREKGKEYYQTAKRRGWEGIIAKRATSLYLSKRSRDWLKFKVSKAQEFVIGGYTDPQGKRVGFGALLIGYYQGKEFKYAGKVGTGYDTKLLKSLSKKLKTLRLDRSPFKEPIVEKNAHWVRPVLVCEVAFTEWTREGKLRHPHFRGLRLDKSARQVMKEKNR
jgi:bifunctional non-homologous end joining protein LigD